MMQPLHNKKISGNWAKLLLPVSHPFSLLLMAILCGSSLTAQACSAQQTPRQRPNIILILVDDMGWTDAGCFGSTYYDTPNIDNLCKAGIKFTNAYSASPVCSPTRASLMTGRYPASLHVTDWIPGRTPPGTEMDIPDWRKFLDTSELTIAEVLKGAGYATASIGKWHLGSEDFWPIRQGFDLNYAGSDRGSHSTMFAPFRGMDVPGAKDGDYLTDKLTEKAIRFIDDNKDRPFFLYLSHYAVHTPIQAKPEVIDKYRLRKVKGEQNNPAYAAMIEGVDQSVGQVMEKIRVLGLDSNTVVIFYSDNGGLEKQTSNMPLREGKGTAYEGGIRVPLIISWPGKIKPGSVSDEPVTSPDFFPTVLEAVGIPAKWDFIEGVSLMPLLKGNRSISRDAIFWHYPHYNVHTPQIPTKPFGAIRKGDYKLIEFYAEQHVALFNLRDDISERIDLSGQMPDLAMEMLLELHEWRQSVNAQMPVFNHANYDADEYNEWIRLWRMGSKRPMNWDDAQRKWVDKTN